MKTLPFRCRPGDQRPIRVIAYGLSERKNQEAKDKPPPQSQRKNTQRDTSPSHQFFQQAKANHEKDWTKLLALFDETAKNGPPNNKSRFNPLDDGLFEFKSGCLRVVCFFDDGSLIICTHGFFKSTRKTPKQEIERAKEIRSGYRLAKKNKKLKHVEAPKKRGRRD